MTPSQEQISAAWDAFTKTPQYQAMSPQDRFAAYQKAGNAMGVDFGPAPGQSVEDQIIKYIGLGTGAVVGGSLIAGAMSPGAATGAATTGADTAAETLPSTTLPTVAEQTGAIGLPTGGAGLGSDLGANLGTFTGAGSVPGAASGISTTDKLLDAGKLLGSFGQGQANQRVSQNNGQLGQDEALLRAQQDRRAAETDAMKKLSETGYILGGGSTFKQPTLSLNGKTYPTQGFGLGPTPISPAQKTAAQTLQDQMLARVQPGGSFTPPPLATPGAGENIGNYASLAAGGLGFLNSLRNPNS